MRAAGIFSNRGRKAITHSNRNFVLAYIFLVALPVLGLVGVLKSGRNLKAPLSVDGTWKIETQSDHASASLCSDLLSAVSNAPLSISQSGPSLLLALNGGIKTTAGTLDGKTINASFAGANTDTANPPNCADRTWTLTATLDPHAEPKTMTGRFSIEGCASCAPLEFRAVRQPRPAGGTH